MYRGERANRGQMLRNKWSASVNGYNMDSQASGIPTTVSPWFRRRGPSSRKDHRPPEYGDIASGSMPRLVHGIESMGFLGFAVGQKDDNCLFGRWNLSEVAGHAGHEEDT